MGYWTEEDQQFLLDNYCPGSKKGNKWIADKLGRSTKSIRDKYSTLKKRGFEATVLPEPYEGAVVGNWTVEEQEFLIKHYCYGCPKGSNNWIAETLGRSSRSVRNKYRALRASGFVITDGPQKKVSATNTTYEEIAPIGRTGFYAFEMR